MIRLKQNIILYILPLVLATGLFSCKKQLDQAAQTALLDAEFWQTPQQVMLGVNYLYTFLPALNQGGNVNDPTTVFNDAQPYQDMFSDIACKQAVSNIISNSTRPQYGTSPDWTGYYQLIRAVNNVLEKSQQVNDTTKNKYLGEAHFFRALGYLELVERYGNVPLILQTFTTSDTVSTGLFTPRTDRTVVMDTIYADLDYAAIHCLQPNSLTGGASSGTEYGRISRSAALALKARAALFEATWEKYVGPSIPTIGNAYNPTANFQIALAAATTVIAEAKHSLFTYAANPANSYAQLFQYASPGSIFGTNNYTYATNKEIILARLYGIAGVTSAGQNYSNSLIVTNASNINPTNAYVTLVLYKDGLPVGKSAYDSTGKETSTQTDFRNRDPRMAMSMVSQTTTPYAYYTTKYFSSAEQSATGYLNFMVLRYGELLLNYAEATYELNGSISDADLNLTINALRNRATNNSTASLALLTNAFVTANGLNMLYEIRRERTVELAFEGFRYWDLLRWGTAATMLPKVLLQAPYFTGTPVPALYTGTITTNDGYNTPITPSATFKGWAVKEAASSRSGFISPKNYLWPIPTVEIGLTNGIYTQNPGWQ